MITKVCTKCEKELDVQLFAFANKKLGTKRSICKFCIKNVTDKHYLDNKNAYRLNQIERRNRNRNFIKDYLLDKVCMDCDNSDWRVLEFDHITDDKIAGISKMSNDRRPLDTIKKEIAKCEVVCANCHRLRSYNRQENCYRR